MEGLKGPQLRQVEARDTLVKAVDHKDKLLEFDRTRCVDTGTDTLTV